MAEIAYFFGDLLTGEIIEEISLESVSASHKFSGGDLRGSFHLDVTGKDNETLVSATIPGRCSCTVERDGVVIGDYILWTRTYQSQAKVAQLYGISFKGYLEKRFVRSDFIATDTEQRNIAISLFDLLGSDPNSIPFELPASYPTAVPKSLTVWASEFRTYAEVIDNLADGNDGFDWVVRTRRENDKYVRSIEMGYPFLGAAEGPGTPVFEYFSGNAGPGGNILNYWVNDTMADAATHIYGIGGGEGSIMPVDETIFTDYLLGGFPRYDTDYTRKDISDPTILHQLTYQQGLIRLPPQSIITAEIRGDTDPGIGSFDLGDACKLIIQDPRFPQTLEKTTRVLGWEYDPPQSDKDEQIRLTFEGED